MVEKKIDQPIRVISWDDIVKNTKIIAQKIPQTNKRIYIFPIPKNGYVIAGLLAFYRKDVILQLAPKQHSGATILLLDDIHDTGTTLNKFIDASITEVISATLYWRKKELIRNIEKDSITITKPNTPDYWAETIEDDSWLIFPWEDTPV